MFHTLAKKSLPLSLIASALVLTGCGSSDKNNAPTLTGNQSPTVLENTTLVGSYTANDVDGDALILSLSGESSALFNLEQSGELSFKDAPDFEVVGDTTFSVTITATEQTNDKLNASLTISISLDDVKDTPDFAVVQTVSPDFLGSEVVYIDPVQQSVETGFYIKDASDYTLSTYKSDIYHIGRFNIDEITKYNRAAPDVALWSYSTQDSQDSVSRNPYSLVSLNDNKAYLIRYGSGKVWIVNPQATQAEDFKIGELDISHYAHNNANNTPTPSSAAILDGKLYIAMQRIDDNWTPGIAYVAVFDTSTDTEIETNALADDEFKGIPLVGRNPLENSVVTANDKVYVTSRSSYSGTDLSLSRIEEITPEDYSVRNIIDAQAIPESESAVIRASVIVSEEKGYFYSNQTFFSPEYHVKSTLHEFNPTTGAVIASNIANTGDDAIVQLALDSANFLWMGINNPTTPGVDIINTADNTPEGTRLLTELTPSTIRFVEK
ncbi:cadherin repeat domain-containing protein [Pseudoalteromonas aurantia]|uniref:Cadherin domain-containing protein n=1 Tax=Pseudoalteromonas aurantia 208 TaxID=1314867 RepID=A0ABR9E7Q2_9GAMM|nr:cadherin repeat domain-containing protein [Pseudoalteromonas aurantia]MBE0366275.1 hypothetical protein [Pseudoalteromonas aurantia 208]